MNTLNDSILRARALLRHRLVHAANLLFIMRIFALGISFINRIFLARILGDEGLGIFQYAISWMEIIMILTVFGLDHLLVREISAARAKNRPDLIHGLLRYSNVFSLVISLVVMFISIMVIMTLRSSGIFNSMTVITLLVSPLLLPLRTNIRIRQAAMQGFNRMASSQVPEYIIQPILFITLIASTRWILRGELTPVMALLLYITTIFVTVIIGIRLLISTIPARVRQEKPNYEYRKWFLGSVPLIVLSSMSVINNRLDILMLGTLDSLEAVGIYTTAVQFGNLLALVLMVGNTVLAPTFVLLYNEGNIIQLQRLVTLSSRWMLFISSIIALGIMITGGFILSLFGESFVAGTTVLNLIILGQLVNVFSGSTSKLLIMSNYTWYSIISSTITTIINAILNLIIIPYYGMNGAAATTLLSYIIFNVLTGIFVWRKLGIFPGAIGKLR
jgi:O-antigen/teichoic acid export membrane protein